MGESVDSGAIPVDRSLIHNNAAIRIAGVTIFFFLITPAAFTSSENPVFLHAASLSSAE
jgi:hypothetical protein